MVKGVRWSKKYIWLVTTASLVERFVTCDASLGRDTHIIIVIAVGVDDEILVKVNRIDERKLIDDTSNV